MKCRARVACCVVFLASSVSAQSAYDAGFEGNPPVAPSPATQGWTEVLTGTVTLGAVSPDPSIAWNAWQITDQGPGVCSYTNSTWFHNIRGWELSFTMRMLGGSIFIEVETGDFLIEDSWYWLELETVGNDVQLHHQGGVLFAAGAADGRYHMFRFQIGGSTIDAWLDDQPLGTINNAGPPLSLLDGGTVKWGTDLWGSEDLPGRARFHRVYLGPEDVYTCLDQAVPNSSGQIGAVEVRGSRTVADDDLTLVATRLPTGSNIGYFIMGTGMNTFTPPGSAGPICVAPGIRRYLPPVHNTSQLNGGFWRSVGTSGPVSSAITAGSTWGFQAWHRDGMNPSNLTYGRHVTFQ